MLTEKTKQELEKTAENICKKNNLPHVYFITKFGKRKHFLAGFGKPAFTHTNHHDISERIAIAWEGTMKAADLLAISDDYSELYQQCHKELSSQ